MATACGSKEDRFLRERLEMDILETKKTLEKYPRQGSLVSPATTYRECVLSLKLDKDEETKLLMQMGCEPQVYDSKVKFIKGENKWDGYRVKNSEFRDFPVEGENMLDGGRINGDIIKIMKLREELKKKLLASIKDTPREETHIREGIRFDNLDNLAKWLKERQWVRAEAADAATGFIEKVKIEEDTESLRTDMLEDARDGKEINPRFSQYLYSPPSTQVLEMDIEEDITAVCPTGWEEPQYVRMYSRGPSGVETAETAISRKSKLKSMREMDIEEDILKIEEDILKIEEHEGNMMTSAGDGH